MIYLNTMRKLYTGMKKKILIDNTCRASKFTYIRKAYDISYVYLYIIQPLYRKQYNNYLQVEA